MHRRTFLTGAATAAAALGTGGLRAYGASQPEPPTDIMPDFWRAYDSSRTGPMRERVAAIGRAVFLRHAGLYTAAGFHGGRNGRFGDARVAAWLARFDGMAPAVRALSHRAPREWNDRLPLFRNHFPDASAGQAHFLVSLFAFNGAIGDRGGIQRLFFGLDGIVDQQGPEPDLAILYDHERFHLHHAGMNPAMAGSALWFALWREGLATYVSARLNPRASPADILMSRVLADAPAALVRRAAAEALANFDSPDRAPRNRLLDLAFQGDLPPRSGYLLGFRAVERLARTRSLDQLARLGPDAAAPLLRAELHALARG